MIHACDREDGRSFAAGAVPLGFANHAPDYILIFRVVTI